jgi:hypothetical protein
MMFTLPRSNLASYYMCTADACEAYSVRPALVSMPNKSGLKILILATIHRKININQNFILFYNFLNLLFVFNVSVSPYLKSW